jgi:hypothetical protein
MRRFVEDWCVVSEDVRSWLDGNLRGVGGCETGLEKAVLEL